LLLSLFIFHTHDQLNIRHTARETVYSSVATQTTTRDIGA
jgi:hypothetical protein